MQLVEVTADLAEENKTATQATEMLETESADRMRLEKELKDIQVSLGPEVIKRFLVQLKNEHTVKFLNFRTLENFAVIILKLEKRGFTIE